MQHRVETASLSTFDSDQLNDAVAQFGDFEHLQLTGGTFRGQLVRSHIGGSSLDANIFSKDVLVRGSYPPDRITLGFIISGREAGYFNGTRFAMNNIAVIAEGAAMDAYRLPAETCLVGFQTRRDVLEREGIALPARSQMAVCSHLSREALQLGEALKALVTPPSGPETISTQCVPTNGLIAEDELIVGFRRAIDALQDHDLRTHCHSRQNRQRTLRKFEEIMEGHLMRDLRIPDLCTQLGVSQRTLEYLCIDSYGMSPRRYLTVRRLNAVRNRLARAADADLTVAEVARRFGFRHLGRFPQIYHSLFGEFPSDTKRRRRMVFPVRS